MQSIAKNKNSSKRSEFKPSQKILEKYADVLVNFALGSGKGIKKDEVVYLNISEYAKPLMIELRKVILKAGGHTILNYLPDNFDRTNSDRDLFLFGKPNQISFFPDKYYRGLVDQIDHVIFILSETDKHDLEGIDPKKLLAHELAYKPYKDWRFEKEHRGAFTWTIGLYGTPAMAEEAGLSLEDYWKQIISACYLDAKNPISVWKKTYRTVDIYKKKLTALKIDKVHIEGPDADLWITIGKQRQWLGGGGRNIPSFEIFTSPDWRGTEGWIRFNQPLYRYGNLIEDIELEFKRGIVVKSSARTNEKVLKQMIATKNADKIGEFSLTDSRFSKITKFMAETLFDENMGGPEGNTHIALGSSYHDCFAGNLAHAPLKLWNQLGFNDSSVHTDIISTAARTVTATLHNGIKKVIYKNGRFTL